MFCLSCITEWNNRRNKTCPVCQVQPICKENYDLKCKIDSKYVRCEAPLCSWKGRLEHGRWRSILDNVDSIGNVCAFSRSRASCRLFFSIRFILRMRTLFFCWCILSTSIVVLWNSILSSGESVSLSVLKLECGDELWVSWIWWVSRSSLPFQLQSGASHLTYLLSILHFRS
jgi:hypothetical protein